MVIFVFGAWIGATWFLSDVLALAVTDWFGALTTRHIRDGLRRCLALFASPKQWTTMQRQGMKADVSWDRSAALYAELFASLISDRGPTA